jgi:hypothetical protein
MSTITYYVPISATPQSALDYNPQAYKDGTTKQPGWLTPEEFAAAFPPLEPEPPTAEALAAQRRAAITARLAEIDAASIRPLRAIAQGAATQDDHDKLAALDAEAAELRQELAGLTEQEAQE